MNSVPRPDSKTPGKLPVDDVVKPSDHNVLKPSGDVRAALCVDGVPRDCGQIYNDSTDFSKLFNKLTLTQQRSILHEALNKFSAQDISQFEAEDYSLLYNLQSKINTKPPSTFPSFLTSETIQDSNKHSTPNQSPRKLPSQRFHPRSKKRNYRAARYDFKSGKVTDVSLASTNMSHTDLSVASTTSKPFQDADTEDCMSSRDTLKSYPDPFTNTPNDNNGCEADDQECTFQEVLRHLPPRTPLDQYFQTVFSSPITPRKPAMVPGVRDKETSTTDLQFTCSSPSCVRFPDVSTVKSAIAPTYSAQAVKKSFESNSTQLGKKYPDDLANHPNIASEDDLGKYLHSYTPVLPIDCCCSPDRSVFNPLDLSRSPYRPPRHTNSVPRNKLSYSRSHDVDLDDKGSGVNICVVNEGLSERKTATSFYREVDDFITELDELCISDIQIDRKVHQHCKSEECTPKSNNQLLRDRHNQIAKQMKLQIMATSRGILHDIHIKL